MESLTSRNRRTGSTEIPFILDFAGAHDIPFRMVTVFLAT